MTKRPKTVNELTAAEIIALIKGRIAAAGGMYALAQETHISVSYLEQVVSGRRQPGRKVLRWLGMERLTSYVRTTKPAPPLTEGNSDAS